MKMKIILILASLLMLSVHAQAQDNYLDLRQSVKILLKTHSDRDGQTALRKLVTEANKLNKEYDKYLLDIQLHSDIVTNIKQYAIRSVQKAMGLEAINDKTSELLEIGATFLIPTAVNNIKAAEEYYEADTYDLVEMKLPEYRDPAFNKELKKTNKLRAELYFYCK